MRQQNESGMTWHVVMSHVNNTLCDHLQCYIIYYNTWVLRLHVTYSHVPAYTTSLATYLHFSSELVWLRRRVSHRPRSLPLTQRCTYEHFSVVWVVLVVLVASDTHAFTTVGSTAWTLPPSSAMIGMWLWWTQNQVTWMTIVPYPFHAPRLVQDCEECADSARILWSCLRLLCSSCVPW